MNAIRVRHRKHSNYYSSDFFGWSIEDVGSSIRKERSFNGKSIYNDKSNREPHGNHKRGKQRQIIVMVSIKQRFKKWFSKTDDEQEEIKKQLDETNEKFFTALEELTTTLKRQNKDKKHYDNNY